MKVIPFKAFPDFTETITLDDIPYRLRFKWNHRGEFWSMRISENDGTIIASSIRVVLNYEMIASYADLELPPGKLFVTDPGGVVKSIAKLSLSSDVLQLIYVSEDEL